MPGNELLLSTLQHASALRRVFISQDGWRPHVWPILQYLLRARPTVQLFIPGIARHAAESDVDLHLQWSEPMAADSDRARVVMLTIAERQWDHRSEFSIDPLTELPPNPTTPVVITAPAEPSRGPLVAPRMCRTQ